MSIQGLRRRFAAHFKYVLYVLIVVFTVGLAAMFGYAPQSNNRQEQSSTEAPTGANDVIATVNKTPLRRADYEAAVNDTLGRSIQPGQSVPIELIWYVRLQALQSAVQQQLILSEAKAKGLSASRGEIKKLISEQVDRELLQYKSQVKGKDLGRLLGIVYSQTEKTQRPSMSERQYRNWRTDLYWSQARAGLEKRIVTDKLREAKAPKLPISDQELMASYDEVTAREIIVALKPSGKPARTDEQARTRAEELLAKAKQGGDFAALVKAESDAPNAKTGGGLRPNVPVQSMDSEWQKVVGPAKEGDIVGPIKEPYGYLVVKVEKRSRKLPKDFEKNKQQLAENLARQKQERAWGEYLQGLQVNAKLKVEDPEIRAYQAMQVKGMPDEASVKLLEKAAENAQHMGALGAASVYYQIATYYAARNNWAKAEQAYESADNQLTQKSGEAALISRVQTLMGMAEAYRKMNKPEEAVVWYQAASDQAERDPVIHQQIKAIYLQMGRQDLAKNEDQWMVDFQKAQDEQRKAAEAQQKAALQRAGSAAPASPKSAPAPVESK